MAATLTETKIHELREGDRLAEVLTSSGWAQFADPQIAVTGVQVLGPITIVDFDDSTATPPVPSTGLVRVVRA